MNVGESFPCREPRRTSPTRRAQTIVQAASLFNQLLQHFPRTEFAALVKKHGAERAAKGFGCWTQFVAMLFCQLGGADSLREICNGLACCLGRLVHLGIAKAPSRSTLSYANEHRPAALFEDLFWTALARFRDQQGLGSRQHKFRFKNKLLSLDSTTISLCLTMFPWARFRRWTLAGVFFVTRLKDNAVFTVETEFEVPQNRNIRADQIIQLTGAQAQADCPGPLRRLVVWDAENEREIVLLTNLFDFGATTIAAIYKERWKIELFFKALKQNLTVRSFVGTSENALRIQIWTALIAMLLLKWLHHLSKANWSLSNLASMLRLNLFTYRDLTKWLHDPMETPPLVPAVEQLTLALV